LWRLAPAACVGKQGPSFPGHGDLAEVEHHFADLAPGTKITASMADRISSLAGTIVYPKINQNTGRGASRRRTPGDDKRRSVQRAAGWEAVTDFLRCDDSRKSPRPVDVTDCWEGML
jgi:hypothetical protein